MSEARVNELLTIQAKLQAGEPLTKAQEAKAKPRRKRHAKSFSEIAREFGVSNETISRDWFHKAPAGIFEKDSNGRFDLEKIRAWRRESMLDGQKVHIHPVDEDDADVGGENMTQLKLREKRLVIQKLETQVAILTGQYVSVEDVLSQVRVVFYRLKERLLQIAAELAYDLVGISLVEVEEKLQAAFQAFLKEMSETDYPELEKKLSAPSLDEPIGLKQGPKARIYKKERPY